jgi:hypothetical protein
MWRIAAGAARLTGKKKGDLVGRVASAPVGQG